MKVGYCRLFLWRTQTPKEQKIVCQLTKLGCCSVVTERFTEFYQPYPLLEKLIEQLQPNDTLYVWSFLHLATSIRELVKIIQRIERKGAIVETVKSTLNTALLKDYALSEILQVGEQFTTALQSEATLIGLQKAQQLGRKGGRPPYKTSPPKALAAEKLYLTTMIPPTQIAKILGISKATLYSYLKLRGIKIR